MCGTGYSVGEVCGTGYSVGEVCGTGYSVGAVCRTIYLVEGKIDAYLSVLEICQIIRRSSVENLCCRIFIIIIIIRYLYSFFYYYFSDLSDRQCLWCSARC